MEAAVTESAESTTKAVVKVRPTVETEQQWVRHLTGEELFHTLWNVIGEVSSAAYKKGQEAGKATEHHEAWRRQEQAEKAAYARGFIEGKNAPIAAAQQNALAEATQYEVVCPSCGATDTAVGTVDAGRVASEHVAASPGCAGVPLGINRRAQAEG
jgi:hypothetical protein